MTGKNKERGRGGAMNTSALSRPLPPPSTLQTKHGTIDYTSVNFITLTRSNETPALQVMLHFVVFTGLKVNCCQFCHNHHKDPSSFSFSS